MDALYGKIIDKSREKKVKYSGYYDVDPDVEVYNYYGISDDAFESYEGYKQNLLSTIGGRRANQEEIIKQLELDSTTIDKKDRTKNKIPTLEKTNETLDTHATELKDKIDDYDWQGKIAKESFGSDTITLVLTQKEREELEKARKSHAWGTNAPAPSAGRGGRGSRGRPSLRDKSRGDRRRRYRNRRTRGGQDTDELGGIV